MSQVFPSVESDPLPAATACRELLRRHCLFTVCLIGGPGNGKTELLAATARRLQGEVAMGAIVANPTAHRDAEQLRSACTVHPIVADELNSKALLDSLERLDLGTLDLLIIEHQAPDRPGPCDDLGQDAIVTMFSVTDGDDKAAEFPHHIAHCDLVLLSKADLLPHVRFDGDVFRRDVRKANPYVRVMEVSASGQAGVEAWVQWLRSHVDEKRSARHPDPDPDDTRSEWFFG